MSYIVLTQIVSVLFLNHRCQVEWPRGVHLRVGRCRRFLVVNPYIAIVYLPSSIFYRCCFVLYTRARAAECAHAHVRAGPGPVYWMCERRTVFKSFEMGGKQYIEEGILWEIYYGDTTTRRQAQSRY